MVTVLPRKSLPGERNPQHKERCNCAAFEIYTRPQDHIKSMYQNKITPSGLGKMMFLSGKLSYSIKAKRLVQKHNKIRETRKIKFIFSEAEYEE